MSHNASPRAPDALFQPVRVGEIDLANRIVMSPMTRSRAGGGLVPVAINV